LREKCRLRVFENRVLRKVFGPNTKEVTGEWRRLHNEQLNDLYSLPNIIRGDQFEKNEMGGVCSPYGERRGAYRVLVGKLEGKRSLGRPRHRWEDNIKMHLQDVEWGAWTGSIWLMIGTGGGLL